mgnify:FL=1
MLVSYVCTRFAEYKITLDIDLAAAKPTKELIQTFQREAERIEAERQKPKPPEEQPQYRMRMR